MALTMTAVVPTRNRPEAVRRAVESLRASESVHEIVVVDDGSDEPLGPVPGALLVRHERQLQLATARNSGAVRVTCDVVLFVDDDCVVDPHTIGLLADALERDEQLAMVGPVIAYLDDPATIWCGGVRHGRWTGRTHLHGAGQPVADAASLPRESDDFPSVFAVRRSYFEEIGGFDAERFPGHMTEASLGTRLRRRGRRVELVADVVVWHDIDRTATLLRRLHIDSAERGFRVAADRTRYIVESAPGRGRRALQLVFWAGVLVPVYLLAIASDRSRGLRARVGLAGSLVRGVVAGVRS
jgi:GT2 family glycosyltransferase